MMLQVTAEASQVTAEASLFWLVTDLASPVGSGVLSGKRGAQVLLVPS